MKEYILAVFQLLPTFKEDVGSEFAQEKRAQIENIATALTSRIAEEKRWLGSKHELAVFTLVQGNFESGFSLRIARDECRSYECDRGRARGMWQMHVEAVHANYGGRNMWASHKLWLALPGLDVGSIQLSVNEAVTTAVRARRMCSTLAARRGEDWATLAFASYVGQGCLSHLPNKEARTRLFREILTKLAAKKDPT